MSNTTNQLWMRMSEDMIHEEYAYVYMPMSKDWKDHLAAKAYFYKSMSNDWEDHLAEKAYSTSPCPTFLEDHRAREALQRGRASETWDLYAVLPPL